MNTSVVKYSLFPCPWMVQCLVILFATGLAAMALETNFQRMKEVALARFGETGVEAVEGWQIFLTRTARLPLDDQLKLVNQFVNFGVRFTSDEAAWDERDYWATPVETIAGGNGDCEDFVLAKYLSLRLLGVSADKLRLVYVRVRSDGPGAGQSRAHMVLSYQAKPDAEPMILDNLVAEILPASRRTDLQPIFSFNSEALWVQGRGKAHVDPTARLSHWRDVLLRMNREGIRW